MLNRNLSKFRNSVSIENRISLCTHGSIGFSRFIVNHVSVMKKIGLFQKFEEFYEILFFYYYFQNVFIARNFL